MARLPVSLSFLSLSLLSLSLHLVFGDQSRRSAETKALLSFKLKLDDPLNSLRNWSEDLPASPCTFFGVTCDGISGAVTGIFLPSSSLSGEIDPSIFHLTELNSLLLGNNNLTGLLPPEISTCINLHFLNLSGNRLTGELPDLSPLKNLRVLDLSTNNFRGKFPSWVGNISGLLSLGLGDNEFDGGSIPESIGGLKNLSWMFLAKCNLTGEIPSSIFHLSNLETFDLSQNHLSGIIPPAISNLSKLAQLELYGNNFSGELPAELGNLSFLSEFDVSKNRLSGKLPSGLGNLKKLKIFHLNTNNFYGELPPGLGDLKFLSSISIYRNKLWGEFPAGVGFFSPLETVDISENRFSGAFPRFLCQNRRLKFLLALDNNFSGGFPDSYGDCKTLVRFRISRNKLVGRIPERIWSLPSAEIIDFSYNDFSGGISPQIGASSSLNQLILEKNRFSGEIPAEIGNLSLLQKLFAADNSLSGKIPSQIGNLGMLTSLHLEGNSISGRIPAELGRCRRLVDLNLAGNSLAGQIPESLSSITSLNSLNLSRNRLTGQIPRELELLKLSSVDLSDNQLSGIVPPGLLLLAGDGAFSGNPRLCTRINSCGFNHGREKAMDSTHLLLFAVIFLSLVVLLAGLFFAARKRFKKEESMNWRMERFHPTEFDEEDICDLREENLIGSGGSGKVYRLDLKKGGGSVAVKKLWKEPKAKIWTSEIEILGSVKHRNIVKLFAWVSNGESRFLVMEYVENGNLREALEGKKVELDWGRRHKIAVGAAKGMMYLHHDCCPAIIHRDIKSRNILLDGDYEPKIADFGISGLSGDVDFSRLAGTLGYMAPELAYAKKASEKSDVYSFGVVLLELLTGRSPLEDYYGRGRDIVHWVSTLVAGGKAMDVLDPRIHGGDIDSMIQVLKIATLCTTKLPSLRPTMRHVVTLLVDATPSHET